MATVIAQYIAGLGLFLYTWRAFPHLRVGKQDRRWDRGTLKSLVNLSFFTCLAAVGDELWHFDGPGAGQQLWHGGNGRLRRGGEN